MDSAPVHERPRVAAPAAAKGDHAVEPGTGPAPAPPVDWARAEVAYFSMEIEVRPDIPTYSGGLGVLAGDTVRAAADLRVPFVAVTLVHRKGYFRQALDELGIQAEAPDDWRPEERLEPLPATAEIEIEGRPVRVRAWRSVVQGVTGWRVSVIFLDTDCPENAPQDRSLTDSLYGGDDRYRLAQEAVLGIGGVRLLRALGCDGLRVYHLNEGHSALLTQALLDDRAEDPAEAHDRVRQQCVFTTHTPVPAGHDHFPEDLVERVLGAKISERLAAHGCLADATLNMTHLALVFSRFVNGVAMRHGQVTRGLFPKYPINSITNGVHPVTWTAPSFQALFDRHVPEWRFDGLNLRHAAMIGIGDIRQAHARAKRDLVAEVETSCGVRLDADVFTIGFARRATPYKRADMLFSSLDRLVRIVQSVGPLQVVFAGKAHPRDEGGKELIRKIHTAGRELEGLVRVVYLPGYDTALAKKLCAGVDLWLNNPQKPHEASGTSGMKAALNGVPSLSVLDGWWCEGWVEGVTGWAIGDDWEPEVDAWREAASLYDKLEHVIAPLFYGRPNGYARVMRAAIALNGSFFSSQRMMHQYVQHAYRL
jgi:starch phosphorylase